jgi:hypothetical protein
MFVVWDEQAPDRCAELPTGLKDAQRWFTATTPFLPQTSENQDGQTMRVAAVKLLRSVPTTWIPHCPQNRSQLPAIAP